jgi:hypothetical protein
MMKTEFPCILVLLFALVLVLSGCQGGEADPPPAVLGEPFTLRVGESASITERGLTLTFVEVIQDARCPLQVECETLGPVEILVILQNQDGEAAQFEMNPEQVLVPSGWAPHEVRYFEHVVRLVSVDPYPETLEDKEDYKDYQATFVITEGGRAEVPPPVLGESFTLGIGESATIDDQNLTLTFAGVIRDVRCPTLVNCAENGPVEIAVTLQIQGGEAIRYEMNPKEVPESYVWAPHQVGYFEYLVELMSVDPHPEMPEDTVDFDDYRATFMITLEE